MVERSETSGAQPPVNVFLSYARADRRRAEQLATILERAGLALWWDAKIEGGAAFAQSIREALDRADVVLVLWSRASAESDWVRDEAAQGRDRHRLVPLALDGSPPPLGFRQYQAIDLSKWRGRADAPQVAAVIRAIAALSGEATVPAPPPVPRWSRRGVLVAGSAAVVTTAGGGAWFGWRGGLFRGGVLADSLVILPFKNLSNDPSQTFFSEGLTEELRAALARNAALKVMAGASTVAASAGGGDVAAIARKLAVAFALDGSVRREGDAVRIAANLTDAATGFNRWSASFDRKLADIFAVQSEIAGIVARELAVEVGAAAPAPGGTGNAQAYDAYLRGRALFNAAKDEATDRAALFQYDIALTADPRFALALAAKSRSLAGIAAEYAQAAQLRPLFDAAIEAARRAVAIAPNLAEAQLALGYALLVGRFDIPGARPAYEKARALGGGDADILVLFALYAVRSGGGSEAVAAIDRALELDPLNPRTHRAAGTINYALRRYRPALDHLNRALALNPKISIARAVMGSCHFQEGRLKDARAAYDSEPNAGFRLAGLAIVNFRLGDLPAAHHALDELIKVAGDSAAYQQAQVLAQWGKPDAALAMLARARAVGDSGILYLTSDPMLDPLAKMPAFDRLARELRLR